MSFQGPCRLRWSARAFRGVHALPGPFRRLRWSVRAFREAVLECLQNLFEVLREKLVGSSTVFELQLMVRHVEYLFAQQWQFGLGGTFSFLGFFGGSDGRFVNYLVLGVPGL